MKEKEIKKIDPDFDGHLEKELKDMTPEEKFLYLSMQIEFKHAVRTQVKRVSKD